MRLFGQDDRLFGRDSECARLDGLLREARGGRSAALVLRGEAGVGKTALLRYARTGSPSAPAPGSVLTISGVESEAGFPYAGLHRLLIPLLPDRDRLPVAQRSALEVACGLTDGPPADLFLVSLAALTLLAAAPRLCVVDDVHWLDPESARALAFVARRLHAEGVVLLFGQRIAPDDPLSGRRAVPGEPGLFAGLDVLEITGLPRDAAMALLSDVVPGELDLSLAEQIAESTGGNPLALTDLGRELTTDQLRGASPLPDPVPIGSRLESHYAARVRGYPPATRTWLVLAAAGAGGRTDQLLEAARRLGTGPEQAAPAESDRLVTGFPPLDFRHPLVRSAVYGDAVPAQRRAVHAALAEATTGPADADRRAWHLGAATAAPDESVAAELERGADRAGARGGHTARAGFLTRAAELTPAPEARAVRQVRAAGAAMAAGAPARALLLLDHVDEPLLTGRARGEALLTRAFAIINAGVPTGQRDAVALCLAAAEAFGPDRGRARQALVQGIEHVLSAEHLGGTSEPEVAAAAAPLAGDDHIDGLLLAAYTAFVVAGYPDCVPVVRRAVAAIADPGLPDEILLSRFAIGVNFCTLTWDEENKTDILARAEQAARRTGALHRLDLIHFITTMTCAALGRLDEADRHDAAGQRLRRAIGATAEQELVWRHPELITWRAPDGIRESVGQALEVFAMLHLGGMHAVTRLHLALLDIADSRWAPARELLLTIVDLGHPRRYAWALPELVEAALRAGDRQTAKAAYDDLETTARASGTPWALGLLDRSRALLAGPDRAEAHYRAAIEKLDGTPAHGDLARARLLYGEWLRRRRRRRDAREQLATACEMFERVGAHAFARRAATELAALGEIARTAVPENDESALTPQEAAVARLARTGATNAEIAAHLFLSPSTVDYHLRKVFRKLGVSSRRQLRVTLQD
ncbi:helix-turn-helix transcriptional regulator [Actinoplanes derwentensis]|uniref:Regulatory protein, luxR family n=1 Tax=Actinoplanes derwentensis TaxID=113562 RepID=A0A1H2D422_9ACTN|nr:LuxR family transcriptional regulator [Actinoplanes derwentensis]GID87990.1 LuxR family transcriptional regulator [Actinoplanes derwentensis]SDT77510.1 regulatory protein, luxR family [Actinoplanes derwentensis]